MVATVTTAERLLVACDELSPQVVLAADPLGQLSFDDLVRGLLDRGIRVIVMSSDHSTDRLTSRLGLGIHGYMSHEATPDEVVTGVLAVARGAVSIDHSTTAAVLHQWQGFQNRLVSRLDLGLGILTQRELDVLKAMNKGLATKAIANELGVAVKTVENHKIRVFEKLGVKTQAQAVTVAIGYGIAPSDDADGAGSYGSATG